MPNCYGTPIPKFHFEMRQGGMFFLLLLKAKNEEKLEKCLIFLLSRSNTILPITGFKIKILTLFNLKFSCWRLFFNVKIRYLEDEDPGVVLKI